MSYWGDQAFGSYSGRAPSTGEYIGPYDTAEELAEAIRESEDEARDDDDGDRAYDMQNEG